MIGSTTKRQTIDLSTINVLTRDQLNPLCSLFHTVGYFFSSPKVSHPPHPAVPCISTTMWVINSSINLACINAHT